jgi:hypothetical protein
MKCRHAKWRAWAGARPHDILNDAIRSMNSLNCGSKDEQLVVIVGKRHNEERQQCQK